MSKTADICLIVEGSYPFVQGGVSSWVHDLIESHADYRFSVLAIVPDGEKLESAYRYPKNLIDLTICRLTDIPDGSVAMTRRQQRTLVHIEEKVVSFLTQASLHDLQEMLQLLDDLKSARGRSTLLDSQSAWQLLVGTYKKLMPHSSFIDYFWSFRALLEGFYAILMADIPPARLYHTTCTGYAGLLGARAHLETGRPLILTEHGIYTNERRVELLTAEWLDHEGYARNYAINRSILELRDLWIGTFTNYSRICYEACSRIITLYTGNQTMQMADGAHSDKMEIIPNGIDYARFSAIARDTNHAPTVAFIGRIVPIKDVKTFIRTCNILKGMIPHLRVLIMGSQDEALSYYEECHEMVLHLGLAEHVTFTGNVNISDHLPFIDVISLTSISEAQPLVILEAGAAGIPTVATKVGACAEIIMGKKDESPQLGAGGIVVPLSNPVETAKALYQLLTDKPFYQRCSQAIRERVRLYYNKEQQHKTYRNIYNSFLDA